MSLVGRRVIPFLSGFIGVLAVIVALFVVGKISPQMMGYMFAVAFVVAVAVITALFAKSNKGSRLAARSPGGPDGPASNEAIAKSIRNYKIAIAAMVVLFIYASWATREGPVLPRLTGAATNIAVTYALVVALKSKQEKRRRGTQSRKNRDDEAT